MSSDRQERIIPSEIPTGINAKDQSPFPAEITSSPRAGAATVQDPTTHGGTTAAPSQTTPRHGRLSRPLGIKKARNTAKQRRSKENLPSGIEQTQVDKHTRRGRVAQKKRASKVVTQIDFRAWIERNQTVANPQPELPRAKRPRPVDEESGETGHSSATSGTGLTSPEQRKRLRPNGPRKGEEHAPSNDVNEVKPLPLPPMPVTGGASSGSHSDDIQPGRNVTITFRAYDRGEWRKLDVVSVNASDPREAQKLANHYARAEGQNARFYNHALRKVSVNQCVRAAIDDGTFTILMSLGRELTVTRQLVASVARLFEGVVANTAAATDDKVS